MAVGYSLSGLVEDLYKLVYPVGVSIEFSNDVDPNTTFPGTTWVEVVDGRVARSRKASDNWVVGGTGGNDAIALSNDHLPRHQHDMNHNHAINHNHGQGWTNEAGHHNHHCAGDTWEAGNHNHSIYTLTTFNGAGSTPAAVNAGGPRDSYTRDAGNHSHHFDFWTEGGGAHTHAAWVPAFNGWSGEVNAGPTGGTWTGLTGNGVGFSVQNEFRVYRRWNRTA